MSENTKIEWCDHTLNPWIGCTKVSEGCQHCYAETLMDKRFGKVSWGKGNPRQRTSEANWKQVERWDGDAREEERYSEALVDPSMNVAGYPYRPRVFVASLADWLDPEVPIEWLADLLDLIRRCPHLDFLMLTKRPELWYDRVSMVDGEIAESWIDCIDMPERGDIPDNVWIGTSVENQKRADVRIPHLLKIPAKVRFLSCEPLLANLDLRQIPGGENETTLYFPLSGTGISDGMNKPARLKLGGINWVICGGESGPKARPMHPDWARSLRDQCQAADVAFFMKQMGGTRKPFLEIPEDLNIREFPTPQPLDYQQ